MKLVKTVDAVGHVLCHDLTQIIPGEKKGPVFRKGHIVTAEDIPVLLSIGKENLYIWEKNENLLHEDEAAEILRDLCLNENMSASEAKEGKIEIKAEIEGLLKIDSKKLFSVNSLGEMMIATVHGNFPVKKGQVLAGTRIIPLVIEKEKMEKAKSLAGNEPILKILPYKRLRAGIVTTGSEVFKGLIEDKFGPVVKQKLSEFKTVEILGQSITNDEKENILSEIRKFIDGGADLIFCTGGMSVDPDDRTPAAIKATGAKIISYGAPVLPGAMFLLSYLELENGRTVTICGLPGCVMYSKRTVFDLVLPRILAGDKITAEDLAGYGEGGLCMNCPQCHFPNCGFGK